MVKGLGGTRGILAPAPALLRVALSEHKQPCAGQQNGCIDGCCGPRCPVGLAGTAPASRFPKGPRKITRFPSSQGESSLSCGVGGWFSECPA